MYTTHIKNEGLHDFYIKLEILLAIKRLEKNNIDILSCYT